MEIKLPTKKGEPNTNPTLDSKEPQSKSEAKRLKIQTDSKNET